MREWKIVGHDPSSGTIPTTHLNIPPDIFLNGRKGGRTHEICVCDAIPMWDRWKGTE